VKYLVSIVYIAQLLAGETIITFVHLVEQIALDDFRDLIRIVYARRQLDLSLGEIVLLVTVFEEVDFPPVHHISHFAKLVLGHAPESRVIGFLDLSLDLHTLAIHTAFHTHLIPSAEFDAGGRANADDELLAVVQVSLLDGEFVFGCFSNLQFQLGERRLEYEFSLIFNRNWSSPFVFDAARARATSFHHR
jgi:hypothetical protein